MTRDMNHLSYDPDDKPDNSPRAWLTGIMWAIVAILAFIGFIAVVIHVL